MSTPRNTLIGIPDHRSTHIEQEIQYGVVWPDGTHTWKEISRGMGNTAIEIAVLVLGTSAPNRTEMSKWSTKYWDELLETRARDARLDVEEYRDMHRFIKRTIVLSVTATEEV